MVTHRLEHPLAMSTKQCWVWPSRLPAQCDTRLRRHHVLRDQARQWKLMFQPLTKFIAFNDMERLVAGP